MRHARSRHAYPALPFVDGVPASTFQLPRGAWSSVYACLCDNFANVTPAQWRDRFERGRVLDEGGFALSIDHGYRSGLCVLYFREVADEPEIPFAATIVHADADLVVVDKPHFLPVLPAGRFIAQTVLTRLVRELGNRDLVPLHRLDRDTAGLVMFSANRASRANYHDLFRKRLIEKTYEALAPALPDCVFPLTRCTRLDIGDPFFRMREVAGIANAETRIDVLDRGDAIWRYALSPRTGRKHQLRVHMAALGAAIVNDRCYPDLHAESADDHSRPLKLLARALAFADPLDGRPRCFESRLTL